MLAKKLTKPYEREHESTQRDSNVRSSAAPVIVYSKIKTGLLSLVRARFSLKLS